MNFLKIFGWILLIAGVVIIVWTLYSSYNIFTGKAEIPEIFKIEAGQETSLSTRGETQDIQAQMEKMIGEQLKGLIPVDTLPKLLNLAAWSILAFILIFGGTQISTLGIKLIKKE